MNFFVLLFIYSTTGVSRLLSNTSRENFDKGNSVVELIIERNHCELMEIECNESYAQGLIIKNWNCMKTDTADQKDENETEKEEERKQN